MLNYRQFDAGPDPFGRKFHVYFKWLQTAISLRHADTVDVRFVLEEEGGPSTEKTIAIQHADLVRLERESGRKIDDPISYPDLQRYASGLARADQSEVAAR
jgi:hypothetical protein